jgi:hypothetical protein
VTARCSSSDRGALRWRSDRDSTRGWAQERGEAPLPDTWRAVVPTDPLVAYNGSIEALDAGPIGFVAVGVQHFRAESTVTVFRSTDGQEWQVFTAFTTQTGEGFQPLAVSAATNRIVIVGDSAAGPGSDGRIWVVERIGTTSRVDPASIGLADPGLQQVAGVAWHPSLGFVAGGVTSRLNIEVPTLWSSADGVDWKRLPDGSLPLDGAAAVVHRVVATRDGFLASGDSETGARIWRSSNGRDWAAVAAPRSLGSGPRLVNVASTGAKIVVAIRGQHGSQLFHRIAAGWKRGDTGPAFPTSSPVAAELRAVAVAGQRVVAVGNDGQERPLVMISRGLGSWRKAPFADRAARLLAITAERGVFTIAGWRLVKGRAHLALWTSRTGAKWRRLGGTSNQPVGAFVDVTTSPSGLLAVALEPSPRGFRSSAWIRDRGLWRRAAILGSGEPRAICSGPHGATAVATVGAAPRSRVVAWTRAGKGGWSPEPDLVAVKASAQGCADGPAGPVVVGSDENAAAVAWRKMRPGIWRATIVAQTALQSATSDVIRDGSGYLATGTYGGRGQADLAVWRSSDGVQWTRISGLDPAFSEPGYQTGLGLVRVRGKIVVVGRHGAGNAGLWVGADSRPQDEPGPPAKHERTAGGERRARLPSSGRQDLNLPPGDYALLLLHGACRAQRCPRARATVAATRVSGHCSERHGFSHEQPTAVLARGLGELRNVSGAR